MNFVEFVAKTDHVLEAWILPRPRETAFINCSFYARWFCKCFVAIPSCDYLSFFLFCIPIIYCVLKCAGGGQRTSCGTIFSPFTVCVSEGWNSGRQQAPIPPDPHHQPAFVTLKRSALRTPRYRWGEGGPKVQKSDLRFLVEVLCCVLLCWVAAFKTLETAVQGWREATVFLALRKRQEKQEFKMTLGYEASWRSSWATWNPT